MMRSVEFACIFRESVAIGDLPVKPPQRSDLNQLASLIPGAIHIYQSAYSSTNNGEEIFDMLVKKLPALTVDVGVNFPAKNNCDRRH